MTQLLLQDASKSFKGKTVFRHVAIELGDGQLIAIKGESGSGKSTLLNIIAGLEQLTSGTYILDSLEMSQLSLGRLAKVRGEKIGYISQFNPMIPKLTAFENIAVPLLIKKLDSDTYHSRMERIQQLCKQFGVDDLLDKRIETLSGGELQRISIIRSLVNEPSIIVADEPTGSLDDDTADIIVDYFQMLKSEGLAIMLATHSNRIAEQCDTVYELTSEGLSLIGN